MREFLVAISTEVRHFEGRSQKGKSSHWWERWLSWKKRGEAVQGIHEREWESLGLR